MITRKIIGRAVFLLCGAVAVACNADRALAETDADLANRFKPYVKTSLDGANDADKYHPITWQRFVRNSWLLNGDTPVIFPGQWDVPNYTFLTSKGADLTGDPKPSHLSLGLDEDTIHGEDWSDVFMGDGTYAHVERLGVKPATEPDNRLVNIDYSFIWSYNVGRADFNHHIGDMTFFVVLYDPVTDRIVRLTYPAHGCILQIYRIQTTQAVSIASLSGQSANGDKIQALATQTEITDADEDDETDGDCSKGGAFLSSGQHVFFVQDPVTKRFEHPAVYAENGTHESFPNAEKGRITGGGGHNGMGPSWLPVNITVLPSFAATDDPNTPFIHYNGKFGNDGASIALHRTWCWATLSPDQTPGAYANPNPGTPASAGWPTITDGFSDMNPYKTWRQLEWPPKVEVAPKGEVFVVPQRTTGNGGIQSPYGGLDVAATFVPKGWTVHMAPGTYTAVQLDRPMILETGGGTATIVAAAGQ